LGIERAKKIEEIYRVADFITIHLPKNKDTIGMFDKQELAKMKKNVVILNAARGGIIVEEDLAQLIEEGHIGGAGIDVYNDEPCKDSPLFGFDNVVCTPHLGASTTEAQDRAGMMIAEQIDAVFSGKVAPFVVNIPAVGPEAMEAISPYFELANNMGSLFSSLFSGNLDGLEISFYGKLSDYDTSMLTSMIMVKIFSRYSSEEINVVNVRMIADELGIKIKETKSSQSMDYINLIELKGIGSESELSISGTITGKKNKPRFIAIDKFEIDMVPSNHMLFIKYKDIPGQIGKIGTAFGKFGINISSMHVGRKKLGGAALMGLNVDSELTNDMFEEFKKLTGYKDIKAVNL
jgi:D-3-phosphoglycerate dehydrogenase